MSDLLTEIEVQAKAYAQAKAQRTELLQHYYQERQQTHERNCQQLIDLAVAAGVDANDISWNKYPCGIEPIRPYCDFSITRAIRFRLTLLDDGTVAIRTRSYRIEDEIESPKILGELTPQLATKLRAHLIQVTAEDQASRERDEQISQWFLAGKYLRVCVFHCDPSQPIAIRQVAFSDEHFEHEEMYCHICKSTISPDELTSHTIPFDPEPNANPAPRTTTESDAEPTPEKS